MSATISLSPTTCSVNQNIVATLTISNSGGSAVLITGCTPNAIFTGATTYTPACALGTVDLDPNANLTVPASGSLIIPFGVVFFSPSTGPIGAGSGTYSVSATISGSDGSVFAPTAATVTVNPITFSAGEQ